MPTRRFQAFYHGTSGVGIKTAFGALDFDIGPDPYRLDKWVGLWDGLTWIKQDPNFLFFINGIVIRFLFSEEESHSSCHPVLEVFTS